MNPVYLLGLLLLALVLPSDGRNVTICFAEDKNPYLAFATKTSYDYISSLRNSISDSDVIGCKPVQMWVLLRHGTRYPGSPDIDDLKNLLSIRDQVIANHETRYNGNLCDKDLDNLKAWTYNLDSSQVSDLAPQGFIDLEFIAKRMKTKFPGILNTTYSQEKFVFQHTQTRRTAKSATSFIKGLFGSTDVKMPNATFETDINLLRPYVNCSAYKTQHDAMRREKTLFEETDLMKSLVVNVSKRLGFQYNLSMDLIESIYDMCRFDKAWNLSNTSPWCAAFVMEDLKLLEYTEDVKYYYKSSYGTDINAKLACPLLKDMMDKFSKTAENSSDSSNPIGTFYFSHASMLSMMYARLGLNHDKEPLRHDNYLTMSKREFRSSYQLPFATNIAAVFYKCTSGEENQVMFYGNEKVIPFDGCNVGLCSWSMIKEKFASIVDPTTCNVNVCKTGSGGASLLNPIVPSVLATVSILVFRLL